MADQVFDSGLVYALSCLKQDTLQLKPKQIDAIRSIYDGKDVFLWLPTGYGKSICYQVLPFLFDFKLGKTSSSPTECSVVLIVSPLVSLMVDQVASLQSRGVKAAIFSGNSGVDKKLLGTDREVLEGKYRLLFSAPEALTGSSKWKQLMLEPPLYNQIVTLVIDEAHCIYKW